VPEQREDEPVVATSLGIQALTNCRAILLDTEKPTVSSSGSGEIFAHARDATCHGEKLQYEPQPQKNTLGYWVNESDWADWQLQVVKPGRYEVVIWQGCGAGQGGSEISITVGKQSLNLTVEDTAHFQNFIQRKVGEITINEPSQYTLELRAVKKARAAVADVRQILLRPLKNELQ
jgi:hypothetical protein